MKRKKKQFIAGNDLKSESGTVRAGWYEGCVEIENSLYGPLRAWGKEVSKYP